MKIIKKRIEKKLRFVEEIRKKFPSIEIVDSGGVSIGLVDKKPLPSYFLSSYGLYAKKQALEFKKKREELYIYKASFFGR